MKAKIDKQFDVEQDIDLVWKFISNPHKVVTCVPGAKITEQVDDQNYKGAVSLKIGPVTTSYKGDVKIERLEEDKYEMEIHGKGTDTKGKGSAGMVLLGTLKKKEGGGTEIANAMEITITGKLAQFGSRMIMDVTNQVFGQFIDGVKKKLQEEEEAAKAQAEPQSTTREAAPTGDTATQVAAAPAVKETEEEGPSLNALPLLLSVLWRTITRPFRKLFGLKTDD